MLIIPHLEVQTGWTEPQGGNFALKVECSLEKRVTHIGVKCSLDAFRDASPLAPPPPSHIPFLLPDLRQEEKNNRCFFLLALPFFILEIDTERYSDLEI